MKKSMLLFILLVYGVRLQSQNNLEIKVENIRNGNGNILVGLYDKDNKFPRNPSDGKIVKADKAGVTVVFQNLKPGRYAISAIHDENQNKDMDQNKLGIPKEGFGFSNDAKGAFGPPSFKKAQIEMQADTSDTVISFVMRYMGKKK